MSALCNGKVSVASTHADEPARSSFLGRMFSELAGCSGSEAAILCFSLMSEFLEGRHCLQSFSEKSDM